ncbi:hypothetical protein [Roseibium sp.]|uniref:hypothetical protein n=1 Tax=Roseibium sp. TaxID=1936156 RepID=UPI003A983E78
MSNFKTIIDLFGLTPEEAASYLKAEPSDIIRWCETADSPPLDVWRQLVKLFDTIRFAAEEAAKAADLDRMDATDLNRIAMTLPEQDGALEGPRRAITAMAVTSLARVFV